MTIIHDFDYNLYLSRERLPLLREHTNRSLKRPIQEIRKERSESLISRREMEWPQDICARLSVHDLGSSKYWMKTYRNERNSDKRLGLKEHGASDMSREWYGYFQANKLLPITHRKQLIALDLFLLFLAYICRKMYFHICTPHLFH